MMYVLFPLWRHFKFSVKTYISYAIVLGVMQDVVAEGVILLYLHTWRHISMWSRIGPEGGCEHVTQQLAINLLSR
jgi:hypothetical protein